MRSIGWQDDEETQDERQVLDIAEQLKETLCAEIDIVAHTLVDQSKKERQYTEDVERLQAILGPFGNLGLPIYERVLIILKRIRELEAQIKQTDELLMAKKHYLPLLQHILKWSHERGDQAMINTINEFLISGKLI